ncbi:hypothetical protein WT09_30810 [Burkholderia stagnalis]|uniref:hypothetical protein n=1 Tax=Burkholderia stagnalis TaxID=1503054 RepID=UPI000756514F|nr:hypothetical protein [Burkholderia stagnalis]KVN08216.1 hypothetical protein WT09_30810 [Burkholderia stagnalis]
MSTETNKRMRLTPLFVLSKMERGIGFAAADLAKALNIAKADVSPIVDDMVERGMLVAEQTARAIHYFIAGSQPGASLMPTRRPSPMESFVDISQCSYCADFNRHRLLASFARGR